MSVPGTVPQFSDIPAARDQLGLGPLATVTSIQGGSVSNGVFTVSAVGSLPNGTSDAPALAFTSETTLGLYRLSAGVIGITGGLTAASATDLVLNGGATSGNVVINTNGSTLAATFSGANTTLAGNLTVSGTGNNSLAGLNAAPSTTGSAANGITRMVDAVGSRALDFGVQTAGSGAWIQSRDKNDYSINYSLALNPNGGVVNIGSSAGVLVPGNLTVSGTGTSSFAGSLSAAGGILSTAASKTYLDVNGASSRVIATGANAATPGVLRLTVASSDASIYNEEITITNTGVTVADKLTVSGTLQLGNAYAAGVTTATGTLDLKDSTGTTYHVLVHT